MHLRQNIYGLDREIQKYTEIAAYGLEVTYGSIHMWLDLGKPTANSMNVIMIAKKDIPTSSLIWWNSVGITTTM